jgi:hypothetical protein
MAFGPYQTVGDAIRALEVTAVTEPFVQPISLHPDDYFRHMLSDILANVPVSCSESAVCEHLICPVLREALKSYEQFLTLWSHAPLYQGDRLLGTPDYIIAKRSPLSIEVRDLPLAMIMEAKRNDFDMGWAQCLAAMHAAQTLNGEMQRVIYGGVSDGFVWRFGKLQDQTFTRDTQDYTLSRLDELFAALNHVLQLCKQQVLSPAAAA